MIKLLSMNGLRVDVEPMAGRAVRSRVLDTEGYGALVTKCVTRIGAWP